MSKYLVTGGAGFLGFHLSNALLNQGHSVVAIDNFYTGQEANIGLLSEFEDFSFINHDVTLPFRVEVDGIFNLACPASPVHYQTDPIYTLRTSVLGALNALELAASLNVPILQASTSEIYGIPLEHPQTENYWGNVNPIGIRSCYDEGKRAAETLFSDFRRMKSVNTKIMRIFNTYGPNMKINDGRVVSNFIIQALKNQDITMYGRGDQTRSFCYVDDLITGMQNFMNSEIDISEPLNFGNSAETSMLQLAELIIKLTNSESKIVFNELPKDDPDRRRPDLSKTNSALGWGPRIDLENGLRRTIEFFEMQLRS